MAGVTATPEEYREELPPDMDWVDTPHNHSHWAGISSGSSSSSSTASSSHARARSDPFSTISYNERRIEDLCYLVKLIIELYDLDEIKPLFKKMNLDGYANDSMYRHRYVKPKEKENIFDDELFKI